MWDWPLDDALAEQILGRKISYGKPLPADIFQGRRILVTGAGGSIGSALFRNLSVFNPELLVGIDINELYSTGLHSRHSSKFLRDPKIHIVDIRNRALIGRLFSTYRFDLVFNAAALKHVPFIEDEFNLVEAVRTNISGAGNIAEACLKSGAELIHISTDKAVNPVSNMGTTKRVAEILLENRAGQHGAANFKVIRFCNVLGSSGSVVPLFMQQVQKGGPITLTHPDMKRFMITISEAIQLILSVTKIEASDYTCFIPKFPNEMRIADLADRIARLCVPQGAAPVGIEIIGVRPGETMSEALCHDFETFRSTPADGLLSMKTNRCDDSILAAIEAIRRDAEAGCSDHLRSSIDRVLDRAIVADRNAIVRGPAHMPVA